MKLRYSLTVGLTIKWIPRRRPWTGLRSKSQNHFCPSSSAWKYHTFHSLRVATRLRPLAVADGLLLWLERASGYRQQRLADRFNFGSFSYHDEVAWVGACTAARSA